MKYKANSNKGFTLIELMAVFAIVTTLLMVSAPGFQQMIRSNRMVSEVYALRATLNYARSEALTRRAPVVVCPTIAGDVCSTDTDNWRQGYMVFVDTNSDNAPDPDDPDEERIQFNTEGTAMDILFDNANRRIRFDPQGQIVGFQGTFVFCDGYGQRSARGLIVNAVGSVRAATDTNAPVDNIVNEAGGDNVSCE